MKKSKKLLALMLLISALMGIFCSCAAKVDEAVVLAEFKEK